MKEEELLAIGARVVEEFSTSKYTPNREDALSLAWYVLALAIRTFKDGDFEHYLRRALCRAFRREFWGEETCRADEWGGRVDRVFPGREYAALVAALRRRYPRRAPAALLLLGLVDGEAYSPEEVAYVMGWPVSKTRDFWLELKEDLRNGKLREYPAYIFALRGE